MSRDFLPAELDPARLIAVVDTREQMPLDLSPLQMVVETLETGDYSLRGLEHVVRIERKSLSDLLGCVGGDRERFDREVQRLLSYPTRCLIVEADWRDIEAGEWRCKVTPAAVLGSLLGWQASGLPVCMAGDHKRAGLFVARMLTITARRHWRTLRAFAAAVMTDNPLSMEGTL